MTDKQQLWIDEFHRVFDNFHGSLRPSKFHVLAGRIMFADETRLIAEFELGSQTLMIRVSTTQHAAYAFAERVTAFLKLDIKDIQLHGGPATVFLRSPTTTETPKGDEPLVLHPHYTGGDTSGDFTAWAKRLTDFDGGSDYQIGGDHSPPTTTDGEFIVKNDVLQDDQGNLKFGPQLSDEATDKSVTFPSGNTLTFRDGPARGLNPVSRLRIADHANPGMATFYQHGEVVARLDPDGVLRFTVDANDENAERFLACIESCLSSRVTGLDVQKRPAPGEGGV